MTSYNRYSDVGYMIHNETDNILVTFILSRLPQVINDATNMRKTFHFIEINNIMLILVIRDFIHNTRID